MKSTDKLKNYFEIYTREDYFQERVKQIRKDIGIPLNGIEFSGPSFFENAENTVGMCFEIKYNGATYPVFPDDKMPTIYKELLSPIPKIYNETETLLFINIFILYNERRYESFKISSEDWISTTVSLVDFRKNYQNMSGSYNYGLHVCEDYMDIESQKYPVMIGISPYASQNEVIDLIKEKWKYIQKNMAQLEANKDITVSREDKERLAKIRQRDELSKKVEDVVYNYKKLSINDLRKAIKEKTGEILDPGEVGKIRSLAKKRRNGK